jgi:hypothetical protein
VSIWRRIGMIVLQGEVLKLEMSDTVVSTLKF